MPLIPMYEILSVLFDSPPAAARREKEFFGDTPNPGIGLRPLHACFTLLVFAIVVLHRELPISG